MKTFVRAIVTGFGLTLGATLFRKVAKKLGLEEDSKATSPNPAPPSAPMVPESGTTAPQES
jgi:hypothetical protein